MKKNVIRILVGVAIILAFLIQRNCAEAKLKKVQNELKGEKLKKNELVKINEEQSRVMLDDRSSKKQLRKLVDSLGVALEGKPKEIIRIITKEVEVEKESDNIEVDDSYITINSYYPQKEDYFVKYKNKINLKDTVGTESWDIGSVEITVIVSERKDGIYNVDVKLPSFLSLSKIKAVSLPRETKAEKRKSNFGYIAGVGVGKDFDLEKRYVRGSLGLRYRKVYLDIGANSNNMGDISLKYEF